jgi:hypothetical protein
VSAGGEILKGRDFEQIRDKAGGYSRHKVSIIHIFPYFYLLLITSRFALSEEGKQIGGAK